MKPDILSNIELYYSHEENTTEDQIVIKEEEFKHAVQVMRNSVGGVLYTTNGKGSIFKCEIVTIEKNKLRAKVSVVYHKENKLANIFFCIPKIKNPDRLKFAIEKCVELGITNFILFESERTISKSSNMKRLEKIALSAMKQSLHSYLPSIKLINSLKDVADLKGGKILFDQGAYKKFSFINNRDVDYYFIFGPEGGLTEKEIKLFIDANIFSLGGYRLRSETAIVKCASLL